MSNLSRKEADLVFKASYKPVFLLLIKFFFVEIDFLEDLAHLGGEFFHADRVSFCDELLIHIFNEIMQERFLYLVRCADGASQLVEHKLKFLTIHLLRIILTIKNEKKVHPLFEVTPTVEYDHTHDFKHIDVVALEMPLRVV